MQAKLKSPEEKIKRMTQELAAAYAEAALAEAISNNKGYDEVIQKLGQQLLEAHRIPTNAVTGTCTPPGTTQPQLMTEAECSQIPGCNDWHTGQVPTAAIEWLPIRTPLLGGSRDSSVEVFGKLGQVLAATYAKRMTAEAACHEVIRELSQLITEANKRPAAHDPLARSSCKAVQGKPE